MAAEAHPFLPAPPLAPTLAALGDDPRAAIDQLHESRFRYVQLSAAQRGLRPRELDRSARRDLLATMRRREIEPAGIDLWIPPEHFRDPARIDRAVSALLAAIEMAADLGRAPVSTILPAREERETAVGADEAVSSILAAAHRHGVPLADHSVPVSDRECDEIFGIGIDPVAWLANGGDPVDAVIADASKLVAARLCDLSLSGMRTPIGESAGRLDVEAYKAALSVGGYERPVVLDARQWADPWVGIERTREAWR